MQGLKRKRRERKITLKTLAKEIGVSYSTVSMWETTETLPRRDTLEKLCKFFGCTIDELM